MLQYSVSEKEVHILADLDGTFFLVDYKYLQSILRHPDPSLRFKHFNQNKFQFINSMLDEYQSKNPTLRPFTARANVQNELYNNLLKWLKETWHDWPGAFELISAETNIPIHNLCLGDVEGNFSAGVSARIIAAMQMESRTITEFPRNNFLNYIDLLFSSQFRKLYLPEIAEQYMINKIPHLFLQAQDISSTSPSKEHHLFIMEDREDILDALYDFYVVEQKLFLIPSNIVVHIFHCHYDTGVIRPYSSEEKHIFQGTGEAYPYYRQILKDCRYDLSQLSSHQQIVDDYGNHPQPPLKNFEDLTDTVSRINGHLDLRFPITNPNDEIITLNDREKIKILLTKIRISALCFADPAMKQNMITISDMLTLIMVSQSAKELYESLKSGIDLLSQIAEMFLCKLVLEQPAHHEAAPHESIKNEEELDEEELDEETSDESAPNEPKLYESENKLAQRLSNEFINNLNALIRFLSEKYFILMVNNSAEVAQNIYNQVFSFCNAPNVTENDTTELENTISQLEPVDKRLLMQLLIHHRQKRQETPFYKSEGYLQRFNKIRELLQPASVLATPQNTTEYKPLECN